MVRTIKIDHSRYLGALQIFGEDGKVYPFRDTTNPEDMIDDDLSQYFSDPAEKIAQRRAMSDDWITVYEAPQPTLD